MPCMEKDDPFQLKDSTNKSVLQLKLFVTKLNFRGSSNAVMLKI